jgi:predicted ribosomally synthesized peptide with SipW-like signal peptide
MNKRLIISLSVIGVVAAVAIGGTIAYFNDTETSTGNIFTAGSLDLKVDHVWQTYNDVTCNTCDLTLISDESNMVVKKNGTPFLTPYPAVFVGSNEPPGFYPPTWFHSAWTAQNDAQLVAAGAQWIWEDDPTKAEDTTQDTTYTFEKTFEWYGPILASDLWFAVGSDNSIKIWLNDIPIAENPMEFGYQEAHMLHIDAALVNSHIVQGTNVLTFEVKNWAPSGYQGTPYTNPGGLIYKFYISGDCKNNYFKENCTLFGEKNLIPGQDYFFNFEDVKPGDYGTNIISLHVYDNDAHACLIVHDVDDQENVIVDPETEAGDITEPEGELSGFITMFAWEDVIENNSYDSGETVLLSANSPFTDRILASLIACETKNVGLAWCAGTQSVTGSTISCDGSTMGDIAQTDIMTASLTAYVEQQRNNSGFDCSQVDLTPEP